MILLRSEIQSQISTGVMERLLWEVIQGHDRANIYRHTKRITKINVSNRRNWPTNCPTHMQRIHEGEYRRGSGKDQRSRWGPNYKDQRSILAMGHLRADEVADAHLCHVVHDEPGKNSYIFIANREPKIYF